MDIYCIYHKTREKTKPFWLSIQKIIYNFAEDIVPITFWDMVSTIGKYIFQEKKWQKRKQQQKQRHARRQLLQQQSVHVQQR
ncbi:MAG: hypothetical protein PUC02_01795, partial [Bacteroidales bacterium]|nr:hypothetical protein [Bacteroidales bacterium]